MLTLASKAVQKVSEGIGHGRQQDWASTDDIRNALFKQSGRLKGKNIFVFYFRVCYAIHCMKKQN
jgi:hypothetical protein